MSLSILRLREILNSGDQLDSTRAFIALEDAPNPALYVYEKSLALQMMKHSDLKPINFMDFWKVLTGVTAKDISNVEHYFTKTPLLLHHQIHFEARRSLMPLYRHIEAGIPIWIDVFNADFLAQYSAQMSIHTIEFVDTYLDALFKEIITRELGLDPSDFPALPGKIFQFLTRLDILMDYEAKLNTLRTFLAAHWPIKEGRSVEELWALISVTVMGTDTLSGALMYLIEHHKEDLTVDKLLERARPVSLVSREATVPIQLNELHLSVDQRVYISTAFLNEDQKVEAIPFGLGVHLCPGKKMSLILLSSFLKAWQARPHLHTRFSKVKFFRESVLKAKDIK